MIRYEKVAVNLLYCFDHGSIVQFIKKYIQNKDVVLLLFCLDGDITMDLVNLAMTYVSDDLKNKKIIVGVLADKNRIIPFPSHVKKLYMPLDDDLFFKRR